MAVLPEEGSRGDYHADSEIPGVPEKRPPEARAAFSSATAGIVRCIQRLEEQKANIVDMGGKLKPGGRILTASGVTDGPFAEAKEVVGGYMVVAADNYDGAIEIARECRNGVYAHVQAGYAAYPNSCGGGPCSGAV
jgi:hypothetical protein